MLFYPRFVTKNEALVSSVCVQFYTALSQQPLLILLLCVVALVDFWHFNIITQRSVIPYWRLVVTAERITENLYILHGGGSVTNWKKYKNLLRHTTHLYAQPEAAKIGEVSEFLPSLDLPSTATDQNRIITREMKKYRRPYQDWSPIKCWALMVRLWKIIININIL